ncbi:MAG: PucR family transcriptional regulator [Mycobacteriaceae bacterium]
MAWELPSEPVRALMRRGAKIVMASPQQWIDELDAATLAPEEMRAIREDADLANALRLTNRANLLHWATANAANPGAPVAPNLGPEPMGVARDVVRRGLNESVLQAYRIGQNVAWQRWMSIAFTLTSDPAELREMLDVSAKSIFTFIEATITGVAEQMNRERAELAAGTHAERLEVVELLMIGAPISPRRAELTLGYRLDQTHTGAVAWTDDPTDDSGVVDRVPELVERLTGCRPLVVVPSAATRWLWLPGSTGLDEAAVETALVTLPGLRVAIGTAAAGVNGFRRSHLDAVTTQRTMARLHTARRVATFETVRLVALITQNPDSAERFVADTLGGLAHASAELCDSVATYVAEQCNASRAAERLYTHRNTLLRRLARADTLLPRPLHTNLVKVAVALEVRRFSGGPD